MPGFDKDPQSKEAATKKTEKKNASPERKEKNVTAQDVVDAQRNILLKYKNGLYSWTDKKTTTAYDVTIQGNNIALHKHHAGEITLLFKGELNKGQLTITLDKMGTGVIDRNANTYSGSKKGLENAKSMLEACKTYIEKDLNSNEVSTLEKDLDQAYA